MDIYLTRPRQTDVEELHQLFRSVIEDAFTKDGIDDRDGIIEEVQNQMGLLRQDLASNGSQVYFLLARTEEQIIGTVAYSPANALIRGNLKTDYENTPEITSVYVLPKFQGRGVGSLLFNGILISLHTKQVERFCLDGGYKASQGYWMTKLGDPNITLTDYWGKGLDHMIWLRNLSDLKICYEIR